jgi:hypothetical protein
MTKTKVTITQANFDAIARMLPTGEQMQEVEDAYALAVGRVSGAWNYLHQALGGLFAVIIIGGDVDLLLAAWRSIENDRSQREMLRAVINAASPERWKDMPEAAADLLWLLKRADKLADVRNDAVHALVSLQLGAKIAEMNVSQSGGGKRERKLRANAEKGRKLLDEFAKCKQDTNALSIFVRRAAFALAKPDRQAWPSDRPEQIWAAPKQ